jgi:Na+-transporting methylmalonyl-CoA/oxaloacetate decarboxylase gamma subunit
LGLMRDKLPACKGLGAVMQKLFLFLLILVAVWYVRRALATAQESREHRAERPAPGASEVKSEMMRECSQCGVLVPESEGIVVEEQFYCSPEHAHVRGRRPDA